MKGLVYFVERKKKHIVNLEVNRPNLQEIFKALTIKGVPDSADSDGSPITTFKDDTVGPTKWQRFMEYIKQIKKAMVPSPTTEKPDDDFFKNKMKKDSSEGKQSVPVKKEEKKSLTEDDLRKKMEEAKEIMR